MKKVILFVGLPGVGKSTYYKNNFEKHGYSRTSSDDYIENVAKSKNLTYNEVFVESVKDATEYFFSRVDECVENNLDFVVDRTNLTKNARKKILQLIPDDYIVECYVFPTPNTEKWKQWLNRPGKNIPNNVLENMINSFEEVRLDEGFDKIVFISDDFHSK